jgi:hypothetical protein
MKRGIALIVLVGLFAAVGVHAQQAGAPCLVGPSASPTICQAGVSYGVSVGTTDLTILGADPAGQKTCLVIQALSLNSGNVCLAYNNTANATNGPCEELTPGSPDYVFNLPTGNGAPLVPTGPIHAIARTGTVVLTYRYCR